MDKDSDLPSHQNAQHFTQHNLVIGCPRPSSSQISKTQPAVSEDVSQVRASEQDHPHQGSGQQGSGRSKVRRRRNNRHRNKEDENGQVKPTIQNQDSDQYEEITTASVETQNPRLAFRPETASKPNAAAIPNFTVADEASVDRPTKKHGKHARDRPGNEGPQASEATLPPRLKEEGPLGQRNNWKKEKTPSAAYLSAAGQPLEMSSTPKRLLIICDLNGTLLWRRGRPARTNFEPRPGAFRFLRYVVNNHILMFWSSAMPRNVVPIVTRLLRETNGASTTDGGEKQPAETRQGGTRRGKVGSPAHIGSVRDKHGNIIDVPVWARDQLCLGPGEYYRADQVYKRLGHVWRDWKVGRLHPDCRAGQKWSLEDSLLLDDNNEKAATEPFNLVQVPPLTKAGWPCEKMLEEKQIGHPVLREVEEYLERAKYATNVAAYVRENAFKMPAQYYEEMGKCTEVQLPQQGGEGEEKTGIEEELRKYNLTEE